MIKTEGSWMWEEPEDLARKFHELYQSRSPDYGFEADEEPFDPTSRKGRLLIEVFSEFSIIINGWKVIRLWKDPWGYLMRVERGH